MNILAAHNDGILSLAIDMEEIAAMNIPDVKKPGMKITLKSGVVIHCPEWPTRTCEATIKRWAKRYRERGVEAFFTPAPKRVGSRLTSERVAQVQGLLDEGLSVPQVSEQTGVLGTTLHKAIGSGRLRVLKKKTRART